MGLAAALPEAPAADTAAAAGMRQGRRWNAAPAQNKNSANYIDENKDGICDYFGADKQGNGNGQGQNTDGANYVDENKDGICDNFGTEKQGAGAGQRNGKQAGGRGGWRNK